jgi:hypothetical protein
MTDDDLQVQRHSRHFMSGGMAAVLIFSLLIYALSWSIGGNDQLDTMGGKAGLTVVVVGLLISMIATVLTKPKD